MSDVSADAAVLSGLFDGRVSHTISHHPMRHLMTAIEDRLMRTTINIDDDLLAKATKLVGPLDRSAMVREALVALIQRESGKRLARLGGSEPNLKLAPRRRGPAAN